jgi:hypothetical protein
MQVNWDKLAQVRELQDYFAEDAAEFRSRIEARMQEMQIFDPEEMDKLAILRALEVTNGCTQWGFRRGDEQALSVEQTRACMQLSMGCMKAQRVDFPNGESIQFCPAAKQLMTANRRLYQDAFKNNVPGADREFYACSTAQFLVYGRARMQRAMQTIADHYESLFSSYYTQRGQNYINAYLEALNDES